MKKVGNFQTEDARRLSEQLDRFQDAVDAETSDIRASFMPIQKQLSFNTGSSTTSTILPGQIAVCDMTLGNVAVTLAPSPGNAPGWLAIVKQTVANNVVVSASGQVAPGVPRKVNGAASKTYAVVGLAWLYFDGANWWG